MTEIRDQSIPREERVLLAVKAYQQGQFDSTHKAATAYDVPQSTVSGRLRETALVQWVLSMDERGMPPTVVYTRRMANLLLSEARPRNCRRDWVRKFVGRHNEIKAKYSRRYDYQRAKCEDPKTIQERYDRVAMAKQKWGILDENVYNFDETGFQMGVIATARPGNREWVTVIESINCQGWALPAMVIFQGKAHQVSRAVPGWWTRLYRVRWVVPVATPARSADPEAARTFREGQYKLALEAWPRVQLLFLLSSR
ncbi:helix-turn-helix, psq domain-containing protein [Hirsutella rhossiliensis]